MKFKHKLIAHSAVALTAVVGVLAIAMVAGRQVGRILGDLETGHLPRVELSRNLREALEAVQLGYREAVAAADPDLLAEAKGRGAASVQTLESYARVPGTDPEAVATLRRTLTEYLAFVHETSQLMIARDPGAGERLAKLSTDYAAVEGAVRALEARHREEMAASFGDARAIQASAVNRVRLITLLCALLLAGVSAWIITQFVRRLSRLTLVTNRIAEHGDLTQRIEVSSDEVGELGRAFEKMVERLRAVPRGIQESVDKLVAAAAEIYAATQEQEAAAQHQASAVEEVSQTMKSLLESATHISESAQGVLSNAERAQSTSGVTAERIAELTQHTQRMSEILEVIREIADRSDLLALNASLEGTRAGEAGKGFSLVAAEMRRLAERVTASVHDVKKLVGDVRASGSSTVLVTEESQKLALGTAASARQITFVTQQQRSSTEQVARNMQDVAGVIAQSVASIRQNKQAAENLKQQTDRLAAIVAQFRVDDQGPRA